MESFLSPEFIQSIRDAEASDFWIIVSILVIAAVAGFFLTFRFWKRARLIEDTPTSKIRSAAQGYVEIRGHARMMDGDPIVAPLTGTRCCWWRYKIEKKETYYSDGKRRTRWRTISSGVSDGLFHAVDDTGQCVVDPEGAEVTGEDRDSWYGSTPRPRAGPRGGRSAGSLLLGGGRYRYTEYRLHSGSPLYAMGFFRTHSGHSEPFNTDREVATLLSQWKRDTDVLLSRFDENDDGEIDLKEWERARRAAQREVEAGQRKRALEPGVHTLRKPGDGRPFLLSTLPQDKLAGRYRWYARGCLALFFLTGAAAVFGITTRLGG